MTNLLDDAFRMAVSFVVIAILVRWGWSLLQPFAGWLFAAVGLYLLARYAVRRYRRW
jgi:predicted PurR-regulated permease PerM